jgi:sec-independent protein translocase protein TatC
MALVPVPGAPLDRADDDHHIHLTDPDVIQDDGRMSFLEHLDELRKRLIAAVIAILIGCGVAFIFIEDIFRFVFTPMQALIPSGGTFIATEGPEVFMLYIKIGALAGLLLSLPFVIWQLWLFIAPGLYAHEKRFAIPFVLLSSLFFFAGAYFSHRVAFPWTWSWFMSFESDFVHFMPKMGPAFGLYIKMMLGLGAVFQMPMVVLFMARMKMVTAGFLVKNFKYAFLIIAILGAVLSPGGDIVSQAVLAGPMLVLYVISIGVAWIAAPRRSSEDT